MSAVFSGGSTKAEVSKVRYKRERLSEQRNKLVDDIKLEVEKNYWIHIQERSLKEKSKA
jgi:outer membrane protein TolC